MLKFFFRAMKMFLNILKHSANCSLLTFIENDRLTTG